MESPVPELGTFGAVLRFALELESATASFYERAVAELEPDGPAILARELAAQHANRRTLLERTRQQKLNEVVLEPITGLDGARYVYDGTPAPRERILLRAVALETVAERFYADSGTVAKALLTEAARTFRKLAEENARNAARLRALGA